jgi:hypothetical protein
VLETKTTADMAMCCPVFGSIFVLISYTNKIASANLSEIMSAIIF